MAARRMTVDGNEAAASVAYKLSEIIAIYPITPASPMGELADEWAARGIRNLWGAVPDVVQMQSEAGAAGALHGALQAGALATTFTASQGLLLMIPDLYKIAGELSPLVLHVASRTVATHALSIFGDHSDVMACRPTGVALLASSSVQEAHDLALVAHVASLRSRIPFLHFFDGFRTSHEIARIEVLSEEDLRALVPEELVRAHRDRALTPDRPVIRGTAQNPDTFFQAREAINPFYAACPGIVREAMEALGERTGRTYRLFEYAGHPEAERVLVVMGSAALTARETVEFLASQGEKVGLVQVRLFRPFSTADFRAALPATARAIAVLDRTKEPGAAGEPLYLDVVAAVSEASRSGRLARERQPLVVGGRYGLSSKEFTPAMVRAVLEELRRPSPRDGFTVGIVDDVTGSSLPFDPDFDVEPAGRFRAVFFGLGSDGTVGANKSTAKIVGEATDLHVQGYFVYDSKKAGTVTVSHLRFGKEPILSPYLIRRAGFVACHQFSFLERLPVLEILEPGGTLLLNAPDPVEEVWGRLPLEVQQEILRKKARVFVVDAHRLAREVGLGGRINTIMQACFFELAGLLPKEDALARMRESVRRTYERAGEEVVRRNLAAIGAAAKHLRELPIPDRATSTRRRPPAVPLEAPDFVQRVTAAILAGHGDDLPVSAFPVDGTWPVGTSRWEKRAIAQELPAWEPELCIQCNKCALMCPHAAIRAKVVPPEALGPVPPGFRTAPYEGREYRGWVYTLQVAPDDCTGCGLCVAVCPAHDRQDPSRKALHMERAEPARERERPNWEFFLALPDPPREAVRLDVKGSQWLEPLFEFSGACAGCGETPYLKLLSQLFGDRLLVANATGCSSIFGGNLPTTPWCANRDRRGPAWSNSLFEDNAEFGYGFRLAVDSLSRQAQELLLSLAGRVGESLARAILESDGRSEAELARQRKRVAELRRRLKGIDLPQARRLEGLADWLVRKTVWIVGGDGWAYDIGFGGLDHVISTRRDVNILVLDTEVYSNTGGQQSKATPFGAAAKFAVAGKRTPKKDLGLMAISYGHVYVAQVALGAKDSQTVRALVEADSYDGPSLVIAYCPCIAHGYELVHQAEQQKLAVESGIWPLYRFDPRRANSGERPLVLDSPPPRVPVEEFLKREGRFRAIQQAGADQARAFLEEAQRLVVRRAAVLRHLAGFEPPRSGPEGAPAQPDPARAAP